VKAKLTGVTVILVITALVLLSGCSALNPPTFTKGSNPVITYVDFPSEVVADGRHNPGVIGFSDPDGDVVLVEFKQENTITGSFKPDVAGQASGSIDFFYGAAAFTDYSVTVILRDSNGNSSDPYTFTFQGVEPTYTVVPIDQLLAEFKANEVEAEIKYGGTYIAVSGYVSAFGGTATEPWAFINLTQGPDQWSLSWIRCELSYWYWENLDQLSEGDFVTIVGEYSSCFSGNVTLKNCYIK
jgi:hypothetical protein